MTVVPITDARLDFILRNLWDRGRAELVQLGLTMDAAFWRFRNFAAEAWHPQILEFDGVPVVVTGINADESGSFTWFQATEEFARHASAITRHIRREAAAYPGPVSIYSTCVHPETERWFRVLGFDVDRSFLQWLPSGAQLRKFDRR